jgi:hypothetical protein
VSDLPAILRRDDALLCEHGGMGLARRNILTKQVLVDLNGDIDILQQGVGVAREAATPHIVAHDAFA